MRRGLTCCYTERESFLHRSSGTVFSEFNAFLSCDSVLSSVHVLVVFVPIDLTVA